MIVILCADWIWRLYGGPIRYRWAAWAIALGFIPTLYMLRTGQIGSLVLLGTVGFLHFEKRGTHELSGAMLALTALKPHLVYLLWLCILFWLLERGHWRVLFGGAVAALIATTLPLMTNPLVFHQYFNAVTNHSPLDWVTPTIGTVLRLLFGTDRPWLQLLPMIPGVLWSLWHWSSHRRHWEWVREAPLLILVSFFTTPYGAYSHDYVVTLLPILQVAVRGMQISRDGRRFIPTISFLTINFILICFEIFNIHNEFSFIFMSPILLVLYLFLLRLLRL
jgi:hypothetical protein